MQGALLSQQLTQILQSDARISSVDDVAVTRGPDGASLQIAIQATAINGTVVRTE